MQIKIEFTEDEAQILDLWHRVFGDEAAYIRFFLQNCRQKRCVGAFADGKLVSMLFLLDCTYNGQSGAYVYAVATDSAYRKQGFMQKCIDYSQALDYDFLCLVPAEAYLFDVYAKFGFQPLLFGMQTPCVLPAVCQPCTQAEAYFQKRRAWLSVPAVELADCPYVFDENLLLEGSFYCTDDWIAAVRDGRICEYILKDGNALTGAPVGMLWSRKPLPKGYIGLFMD